MKFYLGILLFLSLNIFGQSNVSINGYVFSAFGKEAMIGVQVFDSNTGINTTSNQYGYFSINLPIKDTINLNFYFTGYELKTILINRTSKNNQLTVYLSEVINLEEIVISNSINNVNNNEISTLGVKIEDIKKMPALFGESDIIKAIQQTPGVQSGGDAKSNIFVRGGASDQNLILLDDVPIYQITHFGGFFSVFNIDAINDVKLIKGGFPSRYGGRLSSVLEVRLKDGNKNTFKASGAVGVFSSRLTLEGPIQKNKSSYIISARRSTPFVFNFSGIKYHFYDLNAKLNFELSPKDKLFISYFRGHDGLLLKQNNDYVKNKLSTNWGNDLFSIRWNRIYNKNFFGNLILATTQYTFKNDFQSEIQRDTLNNVTNNLLNTSITDVILKNEFIYSPNSIFKFNFGYQGVYHIFKPNDQIYEFSNRQRNVTETVNSRINAFENAIYIENHIKYKKFNLNVGIRGVSYLINKKNYMYIEPRLVFNFVIKHDIAFKFSYSTMNQFVHLLSYSGVGYPSDYWMPSTKNVKPSRSFQNAIAIVKSFHKNKYELTIETYYKTSNNLIAFKPGENLIGNLNSWENSIEQEGKGINYGLEMFFQKLKGRLTGWVSFTYSRSLQQFKYLNNGKSFPFRYDRPIDISVVGIYDLRKNISLSATWNYGTGYPITLAQEAFRVDDFNVYLYGDINSFRMRDYHRLDLAINISKKLNKFERNLSIGVFNVYNRLNPFYYFYESELIISSNSPNGYEFGEMKLFQRSLFGILPSVSYEFKF